MEELALLGVLGRTASPAAACRRSPTDRLRAQLRGSGAPAASAQTSAGPVELGGRPEPVRGLGRLAAPSSPA